MGIVSIRIVCYTKTPKYLEIWKLLANFAHTIIDSTNNMRINKTFVTLGLATALLQMPASSFAQTSGASHKQNPLLSSSTLPFGAPDFSKIQESDYLPAIKAAIQKQRENILQNYGDFSDYPLPLLLKDFPLLRNPLLT